MDLACGHRVKNEIRMKRVRRGTMGLNPDALLIVKLPNSQVLWVMSRSLFMALLILTLPSIREILKCSPSSVIESESIGSDSISSNFLPLLFHDLADEGLLGKGCKALILSAEYENSVNYSELLSESVIDLALESDLGSQNSIPDETFDLVLTLNPRAPESVDRVLKVGGIIVIQLSNDPSNHFQQQSNYKIVYLRRYSSTVVALRKIGSSHALVNSRTKLQLCGGMVEAKKAALNGLEEVLLEPEPRRALANPNEYLKRIKFLPDLLGDSLETYSRRILITDDNFDASDWFYQVYPTRDQYFEVYNVEIEVYGMIEKANEVSEISGMSDWLMKNVREEDFVVMKAEARVVEEMMREKAICLVDELILECKSQWEGGWGENESKRAYWECLALYGRLRDEGVAVHQWWG